MTDSQPGITFRETMSGGFALGETDPRAGEQKGKDADTTLSIHCTIEIDDVERFISDPDHRGSLTGSVEFAPLGGDLPADRGVFNLFSPGEDPKLKLMVYELAFRHDGQDLYLAGRKEVRHDAGIDLWPDTTTLYTRLHQGTDATGAVLGAGILRLGPTELARLLSTLRATHARSRTEEVEAITRFGRFFMGELWGSYARMVLR